MEGFVASDMKEALLSDTQPISLFGNRIGGSSGAVRHQRPQQVSFNRQELFEILNIYGRMVAAGEWRDYAIDALKDRAVFSVFRRATEFPLYRIEKDPKLTHRQGAYSVVAASGRILRRGHDLSNVLRVFDPKLRIVDAN
ncbi:MAG: DUF2794 domain-containing protein [Flavobacteriaceae bacterium]